MSTELDGAFWDAEKLKDSKYTVLFLPDSSQLVARPVYVGQHGVVAVTVSESGRSSAWTLPHTSGTVLKYTKNMALNKVLF